MREEANEFAQMGGDHHSRGSLPCALDVPNPRGHVVLLNCRPGGAELIGPERTAGIAASRQARPRWHSDATYGCTMWQSGIKLDAVLTAPCGCLK
jgi:hypothetical protein